MKRPKSPQEMVDISRCTQIEGFPNYYANAERCEVANKYGYRIKAKVSGRKNGIKCYRLYDNGKLHFISAARLMYAVQRGLSPLKIPQSLVVIQNGDEGGYELRYKSDVSREGVNKRLRLWQAEEYKKPTEQEDTRRTDALTILRHWRHQRGDRLYHRADKYSRRIYTLAISMEHKA